MHQMPFPKPPPAEHEPLEDWLDQTDRADVGREPFFRGRDKEYDVFRRAVNSLRTGHVGGGTMVFQGAPGAGKTALMEECMEAVRLHSTRGDFWVAVSLNPGSLKFPERVVRAMVDAANAEVERCRDASSGSVYDKLEKALDKGKQILREIPNRDIAVGGVSWSGRDREVSAEGLFEHAAEFLKNFHIVVFVDEAQNLRDEGMTRDVLDCLHRDPQGIPLVAAFFGLSNTEKVLGDCGVSRLARGRLVNLEVLTSEDSASAIGSVFDAYRFTGSAEDRKAWVERLTELSQGWPQHINSVSMAAGGVIHEQGRRIGSGHLEEALARGREQKEDYYRRRLAAGSRDAWVYRHLAMAMAEKGGTLPRYEIGALTKFARTADEPQSLNEFLTDALRAGLLAPATELPDQYKIPIPSLGEFLQALPVEPPPQFRTEPDFPGPKT